MSPAVRRSAGARAILLALALAAAACAPIGVTRVDTQTATRLLTVSALSAGQPSEHSGQELRQRGLEKAFRTDPADVLARLHANLVADADPDPDLLFTLAELSFLHADRSGDRRYYLASAVYAWALLFPAGGAPPFPSTDPRLRLAYDLYNRGLAEGLTVPGGTGLGLEPGPRPLPFGTLDIASEPARFSWAGYHMLGFESAARLQVHGLTNRYRRAGIGAPATARLGDPAPFVDPQAWYRRIPAALRVAATLVLRVDGGRAALADTLLRGRLEVYTTNDPESITIEGRRERLEFEPTVALAQGLDNVSVWDLEIKGFLGMPLPTRQDRVKDGLLLMGPYRPGRIPLVLVHGTASSPIRWGDLINEVQNDDRLGSRYQIWVYVYNTGNPVLYSAGLLHQALQATVGDLDPAGQDRALRQMVVMGHSQGGLLTKAIAVDTGTRLWDSISTVPLDRMSMDAETRVIVRQSMVFTPLPFVRRVVFLATPHRGSALTFRPVRRIVGWLMRLPGALTTRLGFFERPELAEARIILGGVPTSIDSMQPRNPVLRTLADMPVAPEIVAHSIIAVKDPEEPKADWTDGVVTYESAHLDGVASEKIVHSGHSLQSNPATLEEVRRILREHLAASR